MAINAPVAELAEQYRRALLKRDIAAATALLQAYGRAWNRLNTLQEALVAELAAKRLAGTEITAGLVRRSERYQALMTQLQDELRRLLPYTEETIRAGQAGLIESALDETAALAQAGLPGTPETRAALMTAWNRLPTDAAESLVGVLQDGSPLYQLLAQLGEPTVQGIGEALVNGIVLGWNPKRIAGELRDVFGLTTTRALRIARTEMLRSYRTASIMSYQANPQIVKGWQWSASKSLRTCFPAGTMITTESGPKPIETVTVGERVLTHAGLWRPVTERMAFDYAGKMMELGTGSGNRLVATADHPVLIRRQGNYYWMAAQFCQPGDELWRCVNLDASHGDLALEMNGLRFHGDIITYVNHNKQTITVFNIEVAEDHSYVADGFVVHNCIACLWNDGKVFTAQEFFPAHVNCRCSPVPVTVSWRELGVDIPEQERPPTGQEWFLGLEPGQQEEILGGAVFRAWQAGKITPEQFWHTDHDETWGDAYVASSLQHVLGEGAQEFYQ